MCMAGIRESTSRQLLLQGTVGAALSRKLGWLDREIDTIRFTLERVLAANHQSSSRFFGTATSAPQPPPVGK